MLGSVCVCVGGGYFMMLSHHREGFISTEKRMREVYWAGYKTIHEFESTEAVILGTVLSIGPKSTSETLSHRACAVISGE